MVVPSLFFIHVPDTPVSPDATLALVKGVVIPFLFKLAGAFALWIVGGWLIGFALKFLRRTLHANGSLDATVISYLINILGGLLRIVLVVAILGFFGIQTASFAALLAGAGVAVGVAWGGMLSDFAAGVFKAIELLKEGIRDVPHQYAGKPADVEVLDFSERGPRLAVRPYTHTDTYWDVYFATNRKIVEVLASNGFPVPRIPMQVSDSGLKI
jgi:small-conductance mechanosensitive channel